MLAEVQGAVNSLRPPGEFQPTAGSQCEFDVSLQGGQPNEIVSEIAGTAGSFQYHGRQLLRTGERWQDDRAVARLAEDGSKLALASYSGPIRPSGLDRLDIHRRWWNTYIDVYATSTGLKLATLSWIHMLGTKPIPVSTSWDGNQTLLFRTPSGGGKCLIPSQMIPAPMP